MPNMIYLGDEVKRLLKRGDISGIHCLVQGAGSERYGIVVGGGLAEMDSAADNQGSKAKSYVEVSVERNLWGHCHA